MGSDSAHHFLAWYRLMGNRSVVLTPQMEHWVDHLVASGRYQDAGEVLREGLRLLQQRDAQEAARLEGLRQAVTVGATDVEQGRFEEVTAQGLEDYLAKLGAEAVSTGETSH